MARLNRRNFLKALGLTGTTAAASACGVLDNNRYRTPVEELLPYVVKQDVAVVGTPTFYATTVTTGPAAFPVLARQREGRVINVGANQRAPLAPATPLAALLSLQRHYSPDRFTGPRVREGSSWSDIQWDDGLTKLTDAVKATRAAGRKVAYLGPYRSGSIVRLLQDYTSGEALFWEPLGFEAEANAAESLFGQRVLPAYDVSKAEYVLSFGADFLGTWGRTVLASQYATARDPNQGHFVTRFAAVTPHLDQTNANADDWFSVRPGSEAVVALAVAKLVAAKTGYRGLASRLLEKGSPTKAAEASGLDPAEIDAIASQFASVPAVALPGGAAGASKAATDLAVATFLLNIVSGNAGVTFGLGAAYEGPIDSYRRVDQLLADAREGKIGVLLLDDSNPVYALPDDAGVAEAFAKIDLLVALSSHPDESNASAHLVLPTSDTFEDWGDEELHAGLSLLRQPVTAPLHDTRPLGDILLATARDAGLTPLPSAVRALPTEEIEGGPDTPADEAPEEGGEDTPPAAVPTGPVGFEAERFQDYIAARWERDIWSRHAPARAGMFSFKEWWHLALTDGFLRLDRSDSGLKTFVLDKPVLLGLPYEFQDWMPLEGSGELFLHLHPHPIRHDGRFANEPWAQEVSDPMTGQTWDSWLEMSSKTASKLGVVDNDLVTVTTAAGTIEVGVEITPGIRSDTVAIAFGQGHTALGLYADGFGKNVVDLLTAAQDPQGAFAWQQTMVKVAKTGRQAQLTSTIGADEQGFRDLAVVVDAYALAKVGDAPADHPGELTGIVHLERDARLVKADKLDFYPAPDHPTYRWAMTVDTNACTGCGTCVVACYAENNLPVVGKDLVRRGKQMNWIRIDRFWEREGGQLEARFLPMMCQQCAHAPCESVCPVLATYHTMEGLNAMVYNRCVGTRYCANNCPYMARRFNYHSYEWPEPFNLQLNPDVSVRTMGIMEKCTFCVQRIRGVRDAYRDKGFTSQVPSTAVEQLPACAESCPTQALVFGNLEDPSSVPARLRKSARNYEMLAELNVMPGINFLARASFHAEPVHHAAADSHEPASEDAGGH